MDRAATHRGGSVRGNRDNETRRLGMKYLISVYTDDPGEPPYEEWAEGEPAMYRVVNRIAPMLRAGDTMIVTDDRDNVMQERRKVAA